MGEVERLNGLKLKLEARQRQLKKALKQEKDGNEFYRQYYNNQSYPVLIIEKASWNILDANKAAQSLYGYKRHELLKKNFNNLISGPDIFNKGKKLKLPAEEIFLTKKNGETFSAEISAIQKKTTDKTIIILTISKNGKELGSSQKMKEQLDFLKEVINSSPNFIYVTDNKGKFVLTNKNWTANLHFRQEEVIGKSVYDLFPREIAREMHRDDNLIIEKNKSRIEREEKYVDSGGNTGWLYTIKLPLKGDNGEVKFVIGISVDITAFKKSEIKLRERELNYRSLIEASLDPIYVYQENKLVLVNHAWVKLFGYSAEEATSESFSIMDIISPISKKTILKRIKNRLTNKQNNPRYEMQGITKEGKMIDLEVSVAEIIWNGKNAVQGIYRDITDRKRTEEALRREAFIFDNLYDAVIISDMEGRVINWNAAAAKLYGYKKEEILNKSAEILNKKLAHGTLTYRIMENVKKEGKWSGEINYVRKDGTEGISETVVYPFLDNKGERIALVGVNRDITNRKKAENALRESEDKFRQIAEFSLIGIYLIQDGIFKYVNPMLAEIFGFTVDEMIDKIGPKDVTTPDSYKIVERNITKRLSGEIESIHYEFQGLTKDKRIIEVEVYGAISSYRGKPAVIGTLLDITERKKSDKALQDSIRKYQDLADLLPQTVFEFDLEGKLTFANQASYKLFGYTKDEFEKGLSVFEMIRPEEHTKALNNLRRFMSEKNFNGTEYTAVKKDGTRFPSLVFTAPIIRDGVSIGYRGILVDITERKEAEEQLRKLSRAVEQSPSAIVITNILGDIEYVNPRFTELTGYSSEEVAGRNPRMLKSGHTSDDEYTKLWEAITNGKKWRGEFQNKNKRGEYYWVSASISPILNSSGKITHFLAIEEDITEKKKIESELINAKNKAEESDRLKSEFLAQMSHEIRSPINVILSYNSFLNDELSAKLEPHFKSSFESIDSAGKRLLRTIDLILNMAALQSGYIDFQLEPTDLKKILDGLLKEFDYPAKSKKLFLSFNNRSCNLIVLADEYIVTEIFQNLIGNAIKYTEAGRIEINTFDLEGGELAVEIKDTGIGISKEYLPKLFDPFSQEESGYSRRYEGNGLGLALVKNYADLIGAKIQVESTKGVGSVFTIFFKI